MPRMDVGRVTVGRYLVPAAAIAISRGPLVTAAPRGRPCGAAA